MTVDVKVPYIKFERERLPVITYYSFKTRAKKIKKMADTA